MVMIDTQGSGRSARRTVIVVAGVVLLALAAARAPGPAAADVSSPDRPAALIGWIDATECPRVLVQRVGPEGFFADAHEVWRTPCQNAGEFSTIRQFHASPDGRVLAFFSRRSDLTSPVPRHFDHLVVLTLDRSGEVLSRSEKALSPQFVIDEEQDQIQVGAPAAVTARAGGLR